ncbi:MAG: hypothetical protein HYS40_06995 [Gemmatimonadetes bacterium]|nr:hypothetical protein [Gemmatimonadota bacterium]
MDDAEIGQRAARGILGQLGDPYAKLLDRDSYRRLEARVHDSVHISPRLLSDSIGYIALPVVGTGSAAAMRAAVSQLRGQGAGGLILDLRGSPGGLVVEGANVADLFLDEGIMIGLLKARAARRSRRYTAVHPQVWPDLPLVVLVDGRTASAAELIVSSLQDNGRGVIVGTPTFGKGMAQTAFLLDGGFVLELTTARWYTPRGRGLGQTMMVSGAADDCPDRGGTHQGGGGILPDVVVEPGPGDPQLSTAIALLRGAGTAQALRDRARPARR